MIIPSYWAEARKQHRDAKRQVTIRRFGWSDVSEEEARSMAETRAAEALQRVLAGEKLGRREPKVAYNGASGVPIREEVLARHGEEVITRNSYGAHCLNSPRALFADVDFNSRRTVRALIIFAHLGVLSAIAGIWNRSGGVFFALLVVSVFAAMLLDSLWSWVSRQLEGGSGRITRNRVVRFLKRNPDWNIRLYRTPSGIRLLATHRPFDPLSDDVKRFFKAVGVDPVYSRMCINQRCFRARLTPKPWRIAISSHMRPRPGVWPVDPSRMPVRQQWIEEYEKRASDFAACHFQETLGSGTVHESLREVVELHDRQSRAHRSDLGIA